MQRKGRWVSWLAATALVLLLGLGSLAAFVWPGAATSGRPPVPRSLDHTGPFTAGAGSAVFHLPAESSLAGEGWFRPPTAIAHDFHARAVVFGPFAIVALDLLEIPRAMQEAIDEAFPDRVVWLCATHTHSGPGGYDPSRLAQFFGARSFAPEIYNHWIELVGRALQEAAGNSATATLRSGWAAFAEAKRGRSAGAEPDPTLWAVEAVGADHHGLGVIAGYGAHPTFVPRNAARASGDWPEAAAEAIDREGTLGGAAIVQGAGGDSRAVPLRDGQPPEAQIADYGEGIAGAVAALLTRSADVPVASLHVETRPVTLRFAPAGLFGGRLGTSVTTSVGIAQLGPVALVCLPGELTGAALADLRARVPWLEDALVLTLCGDEISYVESPRLRAKGQGEKLVLFPEAVEALAAALGAVPIWNKVEEP